MGLFVVAANVVNRWTFSKWQRSVSKCLFAVTWKVTFWFIYRTITNLAIIQVLRKYQAVGAH